MNYFELDPKDNIFKTVSVQTTYKCQKNCENCYLGEMLNNSNIPDVDVNKLYEVLKQLPQRVDIRLIGAEPTMNPQLFDIISKIRETGHRPSMLTNGLKLRREDYTQGLKKSGLNMLGISMNGGLDDDLYKQFDNGRYAKVKCIALENCFKYNILPHVNMIIDPTNIHEVPNLINFIVSSAKKYNKTFGKKFPVMLRLKSIGKVGYYRDTYTYTLEEMVNELSQHHPIDPSNNVDGYLEKRSLIYPIETEVGTLYCKLTDWSVDDDGVPDSGSNRRGIITQNYKIAPFMEYYVRYHNERLL